MEGEFPLRKQDFFLKSWFPKHPLSYNLSSHNPQKVIFTISFLVFTGHDERCKLLSVLFTFKKSKKGVYYNRISQLITLILRAG
jgi:hypothetical protein